MTVNDWITIYNEIDIYLNNTSDSIDHVYDLIYAVRQRFHVWLTNAKRQF